MATGKAKISLSFMQEAGRAETAGRQWDSGQAPAEKPCSGLGIFLAERHGQRGEDSWKSSTRGTEMGEVRERNGCVWLGVRSRLSWAEREEKSIPKRFLCADTQMLPGHRQEKKKCTFLLRTN